MIVDYIDWREGHRTILEGFPEKDVLLFFSGGKDSSLAMDFVARAAEEFGFVFKAHAAPFPVHRYTSTEKDRIGSYWHKRGIDIIWHDPEFTDECLRESKNPCIPCRELRKRLLRTILGGSQVQLENLVLIINFSLWDLVGYALEHMLSDMLSDSAGEEGSPRSKRFIETAQRFYPLLRMKEGYTIFRPLIRYNNPDILRLLEDRKIPVLSTACEFKDYRPKRIFEKYYNLMGLRFDYDRVFNFSKNALDLPEASSYSAIEKEEYLRDIF
jgi:tRNA(Ile)-lysidine synthase TilS/MesJ